MLETRRYRHPELDREGQRDQDENGQQHGLNRHGISSGFGTTVALVATPNQRRHGRLVPA